MRPRLRLLAALVAVALTAGCATSGNRTRTVETTPAAPVTATAPPSTTASAASSVATGFAPNAPWPRLSLVQVASGFTQPLYLTAADNDPGRLLVVEKGGRVRSVHGSTVDPQPFLDLSGKVSTTSEEGLLSIAFPPGAASAERVYACYTATNGDVVVSRFPLAGGVPDASREQQVLRVPHRAHPNHNGGEIAFGPDGLLYVGIGDGGGEGDPDNVGQDLGVLLAKLLRIDVEGVTNGGKLPATYLVPPGNPFVGRGGGRPETWAWGLRNPWRYSFDAVTGDLYMGDVGQDKWEEIDFQPARSRGGQDYGWSIMEGFHLYKGGPTAGLTPPVAEYGHDVGNAVIGGYVYRGEQWPKLAGVYLFGDDGSGRIWGLRRTTSGAWQMRELLHTSYTISSFGRDASRELYVLDLGGGGAYRVTAP